MSASLVVKRFESDLDEANRAIADRSSIHICEAFRNLLGDALLASGCNADFWNEQTIGVVLRLFDDAIDVATEKYRHNVAERFWDYCQAVENVKTFEDVNTLRDSGDDVYLAPITWLYVLVNNFYREVDRESLDLIDAETGREQLAHMITGIREFAVPRIAAHCDALGKGSSLWLQIVADLKSLEAMTTDASLPKEELRIQAMSAGEKLLRKIRSLAEAADGAQRFLNRVEWFRSPSAAAARPQFTGKLAAVISSQVMQRFQTITLNGRPFVPPRVFSEAEISLLDDIKLDYLGPIDGAFELGVRTSAASQISAADLELANKYPGKHVAYLDHWTETADGPRLRREYLGDDESFDSLQETVERKLDQRRLVETDVKYQYVDMDDAF